METAKRFTCQSKSFISIFFTCQVSACELEAFSCNDLANDIYSQTVKTVFSNLKIFLSLQNISNPRPWTAHNGWSLPEALSLNPLSPVALFTFQSRVCRFSNLTRKGWKVYHILNKGSTFFSML